MTHGHGKSDDPVVPEKPSNEGEAAAELEERVEERGSTKGNSPLQTRDRAQDRETLHHAEERIRQVARKRPREQFITLWHHVYDPVRLEHAFLGLKTDAAAGVDGMGWGDYLEEFEGRIDDLSQRLKRGAYRAKPTKRVYIPKPDGRQRPLGIPAIEDKIVQRACADVLQAIWEEDFLGFSYGFRPGRGAHDALDALTSAITKKKVNWVLDADIRGFFDAIDHEWLVEFVEHRIQDKRVIRHIRKWLKAGVLEEGRRQEQASGTPQGGIISPLLANVYLHYVFDLWADQWRGRHARGDVIIVRYADDFVVGFEHRHEAEAFVEALIERFARFHLSLHPDKTRLIEFGRFAADRRSKRGEGKPETFDFLGFTHICGKTREGYFQVLRKTVAKRMRSKLKAISQTLKRRMHDPICEVGRWLGRVLAGYFRYFGVPGNIDALRRMRWDITRRWRRILNRRSHKARVGWERMDRYATMYLPAPRITHAHPIKRFERRTQGRSPVR